MSGPFGVNMTVISGQRFSGEIAVAASTFLSMGFLSISPVAKDTIIRQEFLKALDIFRHREKIYYHERPDYFVERLVKSDTSISTKDLFWLALDKEGESIAKSIFSTNGDLPDKVVYRSIRKLNLIDQTISPPPQEHVLLQIWEKCRQQYFSLSISYDKSKQMESYRSYMDKNARLTSEQKSYCAWCEQLYENLIPWQDTIKSIQSDFS